MSLRAGTLRHQVTIQQPTDALAGTYNDVSRTWSSITDGSDIWASIEPIQGRELWHAMQAKSAITHRVTIRYIADVTSKMRVIFGTRTFEIVSVINPMELGEMLELLCVEKPS